MTGGGVGGGHVQHILAMERRPRVPLSHLRLPSDFGACPLTLQVRPAQPFGAWRRDPIVKTATRRRRGAEAKRSETPSKPRRSRSPTPPPTPPPDRRRRPARVRRGCADLPGGAKTCRRRRPPKRRPEGRRRTADGGRRWRGRSLCGLCLRKVRRRVFERAYEATVFPPLLRHQGRRRRRTSCVTCAVR